MGYHLPQTPWPGQNNRANTCYVAGSMPLAFTVHNSSHSSHKRNLKCWRCPHIRRSKNYYNGFFIILQLTGRRPITTIVSQTNKIFLIISVFPLRDELDFVHQVSDNRTVTYQFSNPSETHVIPSFVHNFVWRFKLFTYTARIVVYVFYKLKLNPENPAKLLHL